MRYVRRARVAHGSAYYVIPYRNANVVRQTPPRCLTEQAAALRRELPHIPKPLRKPTLKLQARLLERQRRHPFGQRYEGVSLFALSLGGLGGEGDGGISAADIEQGHDLGSSGFGWPFGRRRPVRALVDGLVPDGVASLTLLYPAVRFHGARHPAVAIRATVESNVFLAGVPRTPGRAFPTEIVWRSATGAVIKTIQERR